MTTRRVLMQAAAAALAVVLTTTAQAEPTYSPGASDKEIVIGTTMPLSGPASAYANIGKAMEAYFRMVNDQGGINGRQIRLIVYDDMYSPPQTVQMTRRLVERDEVFMTLGALGTATQAAVQDYMNENGVPQVFISGDGDRFADAKNYPWSINLGPTYRTEGGAFARHVLAKQPDAKIAVLHQDDDAGRSAYEGFRAVIEEAGKGNQIVSVQTYVPADPTLDQQVIAMQGSGADVLFVHSLPRATALVLRKAHSIGWNPQKYVVFAGAAISSAIEPAGRETALGMISSTFRRTVTDPMWADDPDVKAFHEWQRNYAPDANVNDITWTYGYDVAAAGAELLRMAGDNLTRENIRHLIGNLDGFRTPMSWPGLTFNTTLDDYFAMTRLQLLQFDGERYVPIDAD